MPILHWLDKDTHITAHKTVPYRVLHPDNDMSHGDTDAHNMIIQGDNLDALKSLLPYYAGRVKCIYIDPPYNTGNAFTHYDDNLEHSTWLGMMYPRLVLLRELLAEDGSIWVTLDDDEAHYCKVIMDEIFGRKNFINNVIWQKKFSPQSDAKYLSDNHDHIFVYAKNKEQWRPNLLPRSQKSESRYKNPDNDPRGVWTSGDISVKRETEKDIYEITTPSGRKIMPPAGRSWSIGKNKFQDMLNDNRIWFGAKGDNVPRIKRFLSEVQDGITSMTIWTYDEVGHNQDAKKEVKAFNSDTIFSTPKPEKLIQRVLHLATNQGDLVLDSFLGSGTTAAVAHKMGRRYIGIEMGDHAKTHCVHRLQSVIDGTDGGGITKTTQWTGGGGYTFYTLGDSIFTPDGNITPTVTFDTLARHIWFYETKTPLSHISHTPILGIHNTTAFVLLYNGILGDKRPDAGNVLTRAVLAHILSQLSDFEGTITVYGESCRLAPKTLSENNITFKQTPYDVKA